MRKNVVALGVSAGIVIAVAPVAASAKSASFDGKWNVRLVTEAGTCDSSYIKTIAIENGQVRPLSGGTEAISISGGVGTDGNVALSIRQSIAEAKAHGRLRPQSGKGSWNLPMLGCTGHWTASRA